MCSCEAGQAHVHIVSPINEAWLCIYIYDAVNISKGENLNTMKQEVCWNALAHSSNLLLNQDCVHTNTQEGAHTGGLTESHSKVLLEMRKS